MKRFFLFLSFFMAPALLFALHEKECRTYFDSAINLIATTDNKGNVHRKVYDTLGRLKADIDPEGNQITWEYQGDPINFNDPDGRFASAIYEPIRASTGCFSFIGNVVSSILKLPGQAFSAISYELIPIPYFKDVLEFGGWCLQGENPFEYDWGKNHSRLLTHQGNGNGAPNLRHLIYSGIMVGIKEFENRLAEYSKNNGGVTVYGIYNATSGFLLDAIEICCQKIGIPVNAQRVAEKETRQIFNDLGDYRNCGILITEAHSQGTETVYNLSPDIKHSMDVTAFAPVRIMQKEDFFKAQNYLGAYDATPFLLDPLGLVQGLRKGNVHFTPSTGCPILDHYYDNHAFQKIREAIGNSFINLNGVTQ